MKTYRIAKHYFNIYFVSKEYFEKRFEKYLSDKKAEFTIEVLLNPEIKLPSNLVKKGESLSVSYENDKFVQIPYSLEKELMGKITYDGNKALVELASDNLNAELILVQYAFNQLLSKKEKAFLIHGSSILYKGNGYLFVAPSGTGKSTHTELWRRLYDVRHINDDKNTLILEDDVLMLYGTPFSGKHARDNDIKAPLKALVFLEQSKTNEARRLKSREAFTLLLTQVLRPSDQTDLNEWNEFIDRLLKLPCFQLKCNISFDAVKTIEKELINE